MFAVCPCIFQAPFNTLTYTLLGDDEAEQFFIVDPTNGRITLITSVLNEQADQYIVGVPFSTFSIAVLNYIFRVQLTMQTFYAHIRSY